MTTIAHLSDPHLGPLPRPQTRELVSKRAFGYLNWRANRHGAMLSGVLETLMEDIARSAPDHIVVTGDIVNLSLDAELPLARAWLTALGKPQDVSIVPGNHDAYVPGAIARAGQHWGDFMCDDDAPFGPGVPQSSATTVSFPYVRRRGEVAIVGTSSARATAPLMATGHFDQSQAMRLRETLEHLGHEGLFRVVLIHHPPVREMGDWVRRLVGGSRFRAAIAAAGAEMILHGHTHKAVIEYLGGPTGPVPVVGVPAASQAPGSRWTPARYNYFDISGEPGNWHCEMVERGFRDIHSGIVEVARRLLHGT
ncbi:MAG: metallophosphoesterase [Hyphomicrobiales bacterium]